MEGEGGTPVAWRKIRMLLPHTKTWDENVFEYLHGGSVVIAAITSCTNTSNPSVMLAAGLLAKKAVENGLEAQALGEDFARSRLARGD